MKGADYNNQMFKQVQDLIKEISNVKQDLKDTKLKHAEEICTLKLEHQKEVKKLKDRIEVLEKENTELSTENKKLREDNDRLKKIIDAIQKKEKAILFIDEIHTLIGSGAGSSESLDGANILKPALSRGKMRCIGSTTFDEKLSWILEIGV